MLLLFDAAKLINILFYRFYLCNINFVKSIICFKIPKKGRTMPPYEELCGPI